jgi:hypothetical protein
MNPTVTDKRISGSPVCLILKYFRLHVTRIPYYYFTTEQPQHMPLPSTLCRYGHKTWAIRAKRHPNPLVTLPSSRAFATASTNTHTEHRPRPFRFVVGASWLGKPPGPKPKRSKYLPTAYPFDPRSPIGAWRDKTLEWPKGVLPANKDPGHDFFYVQPVRAWFQYKPNQTLTRIPA